MGQQLTNLFKPATSTWFIIISLVIVALITLINFNQYNIPYFLLVILLAVISILSLLSWWSLMLSYTRKWKTFSTSRRLGKAVMLSILFLITILVTLFSIAVIANPPQ